VQYEEAVKTAPDALAYFSLGSALEEQRKFQQAATPIAKRWRSPRFQQAQLRLKAIRASITISNLLQPLHVVHSGNLAHSSVFLQVLQSAISSTTSTHACPFWLRDSMLRMLVLVSLMTAVICLSMPQRSSQRS